MEGIEMEIVADRKVLNCFDRLLIYRINSWPSDQLLIVSKFELKIKTKAGKFNPSLGTEIQKQTAFVSSFLLSRLWNGEFWRLLTKKKSADRKLRNFNYWFLVGSSCSTVVEHPPAEQNSWGSGLESRRVLGFFLLFSSLSYQLCVLNSGLSQG